MKDFWTQVSIGEIMSNEDTSKAVLDAVKEDQFLTGYFTSFGKKAKHTFSEVEEGSQMAGAISKEVLEKIKTNLGRVK